MIYCLLWVLGFVVLWRIPVPQTVRSKNGGYVSAVSVIIPARNEVANLPALLASLVGQAQAPMEIIVVDDQSSDGTAAAAAAGGAAVLFAQAPPPSWRGKPWACWLGACSAKGELLLFLDADTRLDAGGLARVIETWSERRGLLSIQPYHRMERGYEQMAAFFNVLAMAGMGTFGIVPRWHRAGAAFGPCNICSRQDYFRVGGHKAGRSAVVESLPLGAGFAKEGLSVRCMGGRGSVAFRMYPQGTFSMIEGFGKSFASAAQSLPPLWLALIVGWLCAGVDAARHLLLAITFDTTIGPVWVIAYLLFAGQLYWMLIRIGNFRMLTALLYPLPFLFFLFVFAKSLFSTFVLKRVNWKGRTLSNP